jgi:hypothetical protein
VVLLATVFKVVGADEMVPLAVNPLLAVAAVAVFAGWAARCGHT